MYQYNTDECVICHKDVSQANKVKEHPLMKMMSNVKNFARHPVVSILRNIVSSAANWLTLEKTDLIPVMC